MLETETKSLCLLPRHSNFSLHFPSHSQTNLVTLQKSDGLIKEQELYTQLILFWEIPLSAGRRVQNRGFVCQQNCTKYVPSLPADWVPGFLFRSTRKGAPINIGFCYHQLYYKWIKSFIIFSFLFWMSSCVH